MKMNMNSIKNFRAKYISPVTKSIRDGLIMVIPVVMIGSFSLLFQTLPVTFYQNFISTFLGGAIKTILSYIQSATYGMLSCYMTISLSYSFLISRVDADEKEDKVRTFGCFISVFACFCIIIGFFSGEFDNTMFSGQGMFSALLASIAGTSLYIRFEKLFSKKLSFFGDGTDSLFNNSIRVILPSLCVVLIFAILNFLIIVIFHVDCIQDLFINAMNGIFRKLGLSFGSGFLFVLLTSLMWFLGIHGSNVLEAVAQKMFVTVPAGTIISKTFIDVFVVMGGCGTMIGLLLSILLFSKRKSTRQLAKLSAGPMLFNINETMVFGLPIIYNRYLFIPFVTVPLISYMVSYLAFYTGLVPLVTHEVTWTTPVILSGIYATGSWRGAVLQIVTITISVFVYRPFILWSDKMFAGKALSQMDELVKVLKNSEATTIPVTLTELRGDNGILARSLVSDLKEAIENNTLELKYQPQYNEKKECIGAESLLRWNHPKYGWLYPPLIVKLAKESDLLWTLESKIFEEAFKAVKPLCKKYGEHFKLSVNLTVATLYNDEFLPFILRKRDEYGLKKGNICFEITEEMALRFDKETEDIIASMKDLGYLIALDDFSMGHTSLQYLQKNHFDFVKLDGSLVKDMLVNTRSRQIIDSIIYLSNSLDFSVIAEYVETQEQQQELEKMGCFIYQGYLFSPAVKIQEMK